MLCYGLTLAILAGVGWHLARGLSFYLGLGVAAALMLHHYRLIRSREPMACFRAFLHNNWVGAAIFAGIALDYLIGA